MHRGSPLYVILSNRVPNLCISRTLDSGGAGGCQSTPGICGFRKEDRNRDRQSITMKTSGLFVKSNFCGYSKWSKSQIQENKREREKVESDLNAEEAVCSCPCHVMENHLEALRGICIKCKWFFRAFFFGQCLLSLIIHC